MSNIANISSAAGQFYVTGADGKKQSVDLGTLLMMLNIDRVNNLDKQIEDIVNEIQARNALIEDLTFFMSECRSRKASDGSFNAFTKVKAPSGTSCSELWDDLGPKWSNNTKDKSTKEASWDANINAIKSKIDTLNNDSQMDNIKLQNLLEKRSNSFEMATKVMDTNNQSLQSILRNL